ncbi:hypothetical protein [Nocardia sp. NRRL S-836]|uniref:hypothetical protein n=1 Tax=Nocardia sp. NRRL S-836 TaxID=1519492 RepID=UPI0006AF5701|nr:hypothetical protein [Nocardia sp. NRRL S-836]KOV90011.1 hypothetical protein ADL03_01145 [Nocardia sp. NRRL S-836]
MTEQLPIPGYDQLTLGDLLHRIRSLDEQELRQVREHEEAHGHRTPVLEIIDERLRQLAEGAEPSGGDQRNTPPVSSSPGEQAVSPEHSPDGNTPLRHGVYEQTPGRGR